nr:hypothetical protein [uncultured Roseibium sp.]
MGLRIFLDRSEIAFFKADHGYGLQYQRVLMAELDVTNSDAAFLPVTGVD